MFNLITVIIAIALLVVVTAVAVYYGGSIVGDQSTKAQATQYRNEAVQIAGAVTLYKAKGNAITSSFQLQTLVDENYLKSLPEGWEPGQDSIVKPLDINDPAAEGICFMANEQAGFTFLSSESDVSIYSKDTSKAIPKCTKANLPNTVPCCSNS
jgi:hypothetical protein